MNIGEKDLVFAPQHKTSVRGGGKRVDSYVLQTKLAGEVASNLPIGGLLGMSLECYWVLTTSVRFTFRRFLRLLPFLLLQQKQQASQYEARVASSGQSGSSGIRLRLSDGDERGAEVAGRFEGDLGKAGAIS